jgi:hypothetical protein
MSADSAVLYLDSGPGLAREIDRRTEGIECYTSGLLPEHPGRLAGGSFVEWTMALGAASTL